MEQDPRIHRLSELVDALIAEFEKEVGRPPTDVEDLRAAVRDVSESLQRARRQGLQALINERINAAAHARRAPRRGDR